MRATVSVISAAALLMHMWLGCCAHHAHAAGESACAQHAGASHVHDALPCLETQHDDHQHATEPGKPQEPAESHDRCDGHACVFLKASQGTLDLDFSPAWIVEVVDADSPAKSLAVRYVDDSGGGRHIPVRLHLWHQVLLT